MSLFGTKRRGGGGVYVTPMEGYFHQKVEEGTPAAESRTNKMGTVVWELKHETVGGHITNAYLKRGGKYGNQFLIEVTNKESGSKAIIAISVNSSYATKFWAIAKNIDFKRPVEIEPYHYKNKKGKMKTGWGFYQGSNDAVPYAYSLEEIPEAVKTETIEGTKYDNSASIKFLYDRWLPIAEKYGFGEKQEENEDDDGGAEEPEEKPQGRTPRGKQMADLDDDEIPF